MCSCSTRGDHCSISLGEREVWSGNDEKDARRENGVDGMHITVSHHSVNRWGIYR